MTASRLYEGVVVHRRLKTIEHAFTYPVRMLLLDLDEVEDVLDTHPLWSSRRPAVAWFRRRDHLGPPGQPLKQAVRDLVAADAGVSPQGPVRLLTQMRHFGHCFNPVSFYYCFDERAETVDWVVAEVTNIPWRERRAYVVPVGDGLGSRWLPTHTPKTLHVSPFLPMELEYRWRLPAPGPYLRVDIAARRGGEPVLDARLDLAGRQLTRRTLTRLALQPPPTLCVVGSIYREAARLWWRGAPHYNHPSRQTPQDKATGPPNRCDALTITGEATQLRVPGRHADIP